MKLRTIKDIEVRDKTILLRADFNVPLSAGDVADDFRIRATLPTIALLLERGAKVAICSHLGRPGGTVVPELRLAPVGERLAALCGRPLKVLADCVGEQVRQDVKAMRAGDLVLLENLRFRPEEEANEPQFAQELATPFDLYVNDAFGMAHRAHATTTEITRYLPAYAGLLLEREVAVLTSLQEQPRRPYYVLVGGKKAQDKLGTLTDLCDKVDGFLIGGGVANTFLRAKGYAVGTSVVDENLIESIQGLVGQAERQGTAIVLPRDVVIARDLAAACEPSVVQTDNIPEGWMGLDIGRETVRAFGTMLRDAGTVVWTGPLGACEHAAFARGTEAIAQVLAESQAFTVVGGGETGEAVIKLGLESQFDHLSTGGSATLDFLRGQSMPALEPLREP